MKINGVGVALLRTFYITTTPMFVKKINFKYIATLLLTITIMLDSITSIRLSMLADENKPLYNICMNQYSPNTASSRKPLIAFGLVLFVPLAN